MVAITSGSSIPTIQAIINANSAGTTYTWDAGTTRFNDWLVFKDGDINIGAVDGSGNPTTIWKGSIVLTGFVLDTGDYKKTGVTQRGNTGNPNSHGGAAGSWTGGFHNNVEDLFFDDLPMFQVGSVGAMATGPISPGGSFFHTFDDGSWFFDEAANTVWMPFDPSSGVVELSLQFRALSQAPDNLTFSNIQIAQFASQAQESPFGETASGWTLNNCWIWGNHGNGLKLGDDPLVEDCRIYLNGQLGISFLFASNSEESFNDVYQNNFAGYNATWEAGGSKHWENTVGYFHDCNYYDNYGFGMWTDDDNINILYELNRVFNNGRIGLDHEISFDCEIRHCWAVENGGSFEVAWWGTQILIQNSMNVWMHHNYARPRNGSSTECLASITQGRGVSPTYGVVWQTANLLAEQNIIQEAASSFGYLAGGSPDFSFTETPPNLWRANNFYSTRSDFLTAGGNFFFPGNGFANYSQWVAHGWAVGDTLHLGAGDLGTFTSVPAASGSLVSADESNVVDGGLILTLTLNGGDWWNSRMGDDNVDTTALLDAFTANESETNGWNNEVQPNLDFSHVIRIDENTLRITLPSASGYIITAEETIDFTVPAQCLVSRAATAVDVQIVITPGLATVSVALSGTIEPSVNEDAIRSTSHTIILTVTGDTLVDNSIGEFDDARQSLIDQLIADTSQTNGWNAEVVPNIPVGNVARTSATVITITVPAITGYDVSAPETITALMPASCLVTSDVDVVVSPTFSVTIVGINSALLSGNILSRQEAIIKVSGATLVITLTNDSWVAAGAAFDAQRQNIINGIVSDNLQKFGWNKTLLQTITPVHVARTSDTVVTITFDHTAESTAEDGTVTRVSGPFATNAAMFDDDGERVQMDSERIPLSTALGAVIIAWDPNTTGAQVEQQYLFWWGPDFNDHFGLFWRTNLQDLRGIREKDNSDISTTVVGETLTSGVKRIDGFSWTPTGFRVIADATIQGSETSDTNIPDLSGNNLLFGNRLSLEALDHLDGAISWVVFLDREPTQSELTSVDGLSAAITWQEIFGQGMIGLWNGADLFYRVKSLFDPTNVDTLTVTIPSSALVSNNSVVASNTARILVTRAGKSKMKLRV